MATEKENPQKQVKSRKKLFIIGALLLILLIVGGVAGAYFLGVFEDSTPRGSESGSEDDVKTSKDLGPLVELEDFVVNIMHKDEVHFLKVGIALEMKNAESSEQLQKRMPQINDAVLLLLANRRFDDIKDMQGKLQLKADLIARINALTDQEKVINLFFTDFVIQ